MHKKLLLALAASLLPALLFSQLKINEVMPNNVSAVWDDAYNYSMWVEIYNSSTTTSINLTAFYFTDNKAIPKKWKPTSRMVTPLGYSLLYFERPERSGHATFKLEPEGGRLYMMSETGLVVDSVSYPAQYRNVSYGRYNDGGATWVYFDQPSPGASNNMKKSFAVRATAPQLILPAGFYTGTQQLGFQTPITGDTIYFSLDGSEPTRLSNRYIPTSRIAISKTTVLRGKSFSGSKLSGDITTATYFVNERNFKLPVVSLVTTPANLTDNTVGIYVVGTNGLTGNGMSTAANWNQDWDRPANVELFDTARTARLNQELDINVAGAWSRAYPLKSLKLNPRKKFGNNKLDYDFFKATKPNQKYRSILLRNSGNDFYYSMLRDGYMNSLVAKRMNLDYVAYEPAVCFMNGVYYGIQNLRERSDYDYLYSNYGLEEEEATLLESTEISTDTSFTKVSNFIMNNDITNPAVYTKVCNLIDIESFTNYYLTEIYYGNTDWPNNNIKIWRKRNGGKWRWILYDTDFGYSLYNSTLYTHNTLTYALGELTTDLPAWSTQLLKRMLLNETFKRQFVSAMCVHLSSTFDASKANPVLDSLAAKITTEIGYHKTKWPSYRTFATDITNMKNFTTNRPGNMLGFMSSRLMGSAATKSFSISSNLPQAKYIFNGVAVPDASINLKYYANQPVTLTAAVLPGYAFKQWEMSSPSGLEILFNYGSAWKYFDDSALPANNWPASAYSDAAWKSGNSAFGYGSRGEATTIGYGGVATNKYPTAYFRKTLNITQLSGRSNFMLTTIFDDGVVVYVNGVEIGRNNMPAGAVNFNTLATTYAENNSITATFAIPKELLVEGNNVIAIEVHQNAVSSSDLYLDAYLSCQTATTTAVITTPTLEKNSNELINVKAIYEQSIFEDPDKNLQVVLNEMVSGNTLIGDENGEKEDYIEVYNGGDNAVNLAGWYLSDTPSNPKLYLIPSTDLVKTLVPAKGRIVFWADSQPTQGVLHTNFKLGKEGETVVLSKINYLGYLSVVDSISYPAMASDMSYSRVPDGAPHWCIQPTTFNAPNSNTSEVVLPIEEGWRIAPTATHDLTYLIHANGKHFRLIDLSGNALKEGVCNEDIFSLSLGSLHPGIYLLQVGHRFVKLVKW